MNNHGEDGATLLTYAVATNVPMPMIQKLLEIPCFDLGLPDQRFRLTPIQLAKHLQVGQSERGAEMLAAAVEGSGQATGAAMWHAGH